MQIQWKPIENQAKGEDYVAKAKEFLVNPAEAMSLTQFGSYQTPEDHFSEKQANNIFDSQMQMWNRLTESQNEINEMRDYYAKQREEQLNQYGELVGKYSDLVNERVNSYSGSTNPTVSDYRSAHTNTSFKPSKWQQFDTGEILYNRFRERGLDHNQALGLVMGVYAENSFGDKYTFGTHMDSKLRAHGIVSWQGGREVELINRAKKAGLYDEATNTFKASPETLRLQADYAIDELKSGKQGNYLNFTGSNPTDYARYATKTFFRPHASAIPKRENAYATLLKERDWNAYLNQDKNTKQNSNLVATTSIPYAQTGYSNFGQGQMYNPNKMTWGGLIGNFLGDNYQYLISSGFGSRNISTKGASKYHPAIDLATPKGTKIYSPFNEAIVYEVNYDDKSGNYITLQDIRTGTFVQFLHNSKLNFNKGQRVTNKDVIALSGNTGIGSGAHIDIRVFDKNGYAISHDGKRHNYRHARLGRRG